MKTSTTTSPTDAPRTARRFRHHRLPRAVAATVAATVLTFGLGAGMTVAGASTAEQSTPKSGTARVKVGDNFFEPEELEITVGTKVTWKNEGKILHNVRPAKKKQKWGTTSLGKGKSYSYKFKKPGKYVYYCSFHGSPTAGQRGTIIVTAATPTTTTPTTAAPAG